MLLRVCLQNGCGSIVRTAICDQNFIREQGLIQQTIQECADRVRFVSNRYDDTDFHRALVIKNESGVSSPHAALQTQPLWPRWGEAFSHQPKCPALYGK